MMLPAELTRTALTGLGFPIPGTNGVILGTMPKVGGVELGNCIDISSIFAGGVSVKTFTGAGSGKITGTPYN
jgi:hypothetical protein